MRLGLLASHGLRFYPVARPKWIDGEFRSGPLLVGYESDTEGPSRVPTVPDMRTTLERALQNREATALAEWIPDPPGLDRPRMLLLQAIAVRTRELWRLLSEHDARHVETFARLLARLPERDERISPETARAWARAYSSGEVYLGEVYLGEVYLGEGTRTAGPTDRRPGRRDDEGEGTRTAGPMDRRPGRRDDEGEGEVYLP